ncbi:hypothetical protein GCM10029976_063910 [Kribbella albertanoniae]|uniref:TPM domain-containing protein n=1 Tax=Kribbella albertanoniae TaxID=1266829 RepID=A0A4R4PA73_9ACTN|nr:hypothetical protein [Kribbella albertanoniae]TDC19235.1 hypothetical protein E1261_34380 [Kribbella albertanoniae]
MRRALMLLLATIAVLWVPAVGTAAVPVDPRITAATEAWATTPLYVDPDYASLADVGPMLAEIRTAPVAVYVAVVPTGAWFQEKGDGELLAGWLANANGKPGVYIVMDGDTSNGVAHQLRAYTAGQTWSSGREQTMSSQLSAFLDRLKLTDHYDAKPARTTPLKPRPVSVSEPERFTTGDAIRSGLAGGLLGLFGGALLGAVVLGVSATVGPRRGGRS